MTRPAKRARALKKLPDVGEAASHARPIDEPLCHETREFIAGLSGELNHEAVRDSFGHFIFLTRVGQGYGTPVAEAVRFLEETGAALREVTKRLHAMPHAMEFQMHRVSLVTIQEEYQPARDRLISDLATIERLLPPAREELAKQGNNPGAKKTNSRNSLLHALAGVITANAKSPITKLRVATISRDLLKLEGVKVPANAEDVARLIGEYGADSIGGEIALRAGR